MLPFEHIGPEPLVGEAFSRIEECVLRSLKSDEVGFCGIMLEGIVRGNFIRVVECSPELNMSMLLPRNAGFKESLTAS